MKLVACSILVASLASGCLVVPKEVMSTELVESKPGPTRAGVVGAPVLALDLADGVARIHVTRDRRCRGSIEQTVAVHHDYDADFVTSGGGGGDVGEGVIIIAAFELVALPISAIVTGIVAATGGSTTYEHHQIEGADYNCPVIAPQWAVDVVLQHGEVIHGVTDAAGTLAVPFTPSIAGPIGVQSSGLEQFTNYLPSDADPRLGALRDAIAACGRVAGLRSTTITANLVVDDSGHVATTLDLGNLTFDACMHTRIATLALAPHDPTTLALGYRFSSGTYRTAAADPSPRVHAVRSTSRDASEALRVCAKIHQVRGHVAASVEVDEYKQSHVAVSSSPPDREFAACVRSSISTLELVPGPAQLVVADVR